MPLESLLTEIRACRYCEAHLPLGPRPVLSAAPSARILIAGQAPGTRVHATGIPWNDPSGDKLRKWLDMDREFFYDETNIAIIPLGFCYPGKGKGGDLPPRPECADLWQDRLMEALPNVKLILALGQYAIKYHLKKKRKKNLTETVKDWQLYAKDGVIPLVHPSPRNFRWHRKNPWFEEEVVPEMRIKVWEALDE
ncbi:MAG: uracil-DNA glycosylase family protein [Bacteroidota bacterium]